MKEAVIRKKVIEILEKEKYVCWFPKKAKYQETDIYGVFDVIAGKGKLLRFIQFTTLPNISTRKKKVLKFLEWSHLQLTAEIWGYDKKKKEFKIIRV